MERKVIIKATEEEIINLINQRYCTNEEGIVALEQLDNQKWVINVYCINETLGSILTPDQKSIQMFGVRAALNKLCFEGALEAGEYVIDCTW